jgi:hypothetical protein
VGLSGVGLQFRDQPDIGLVQGVEFLFDGLFLHSVRCPVQTLLTWLPVVICATAWSLRQPLHRQS